MYPSGRWDGFWVQSGWGRQPMLPLTLRFADGLITGEGHDMVGPFTFAGEYDDSTGEVRMVKQFIGRHQVLYIGRPDGEGSILGTWYIAHQDSGPFLLRPVLQKPTGDEPIYEIG
jgi:hypothetical protein